MNRRGASLTEILIAAMIMALCAIPTIGLFSSSKDSIVRTDERRERRFFMDEILAKMQRHSMHSLWMAFGPHWTGATINHPDVKVPTVGYMRDRIAEVDGNNKLLTGPNSNPLGLTQDFLDQMRYAGYKASVRFMFYPRKDLGIGLDGAPYDPAKKDAVGWAGLLHMQAGYVTIGLKANDEAPEEAEKWKVPIMCPAIVGRPGLKMEGCPALDTKVRQIYGPTLVNFETSGSTFPELTYPNS